MLVTANIFQPLIDVFESVLKFFHNNLGVSWGLSIVLMTVVIRAVLLPLTVKQFHSMQRLQRHMPELKQIQAKYKEDKQRQQQEVMKFYKENNVNPLGSCLPLAAQLPVFISLFYMLRQDLRKNICPDVQAAYQAAHHVAVSHTVPCGPGNGANFLFISDLTNKATGITLLVLIVLYVGTHHEHLDHGSAVLHPKGDRGAAAPSRRSIRRRRTRWRRWCRPRRRLKRVGRPRRPAAGRSTQARRGACDGRRRRAERPRRRSSASATQEEEAFRTPEVARGGSDDRGRLARP
jgi:YidC/Oxa1 family membrane protein insertase